MIWGAPLINPLSRGERNLMKANLLHTWVGFENETKPNCREFSGGRLNAASFCDWERVNSSIILIHNVIRYFLKAFFFQTSKGQKKSECIYEIINFPKYQRKNIIDFCPGRFYRLGKCDLFWLFSRWLYSGECITYLVWITFQGRNLSNLLGSILENWWFHKYILTSTDL